MSTTARVLTVRFTDPDEYLAEVERDVFLVERKVMRLSKVTKPTAVGAYKLLIVRAGVIVEGRPILFERLVGTLWGFDSDQAELEKADELQRKLEARATELGLDVRPGILEVVGE